MRIGILGAGQLGRMLALSGYPLGNQFVSYDISGSPGAVIGDLMADPAQEKLDEFLSQVDVVTYEFENLPADMVAAIAERRPLYPGVTSLQVCQNRESEKRLFGQLGIPTARWRVADSVESLEAAARELGCPVVAKSITEGYDGKGQALLRAPEDAADAWERIGHHRLIVESFVQFARELSVIAVRGQDDEIAVYPMAENVHVDGILRYSIAPAPSLSSTIQVEAETYIRALLKEMDHVGVLALELFETDDGLLANEMAPRVHNSGHWTQDGANTSQFENHIRAITGMPLGDVSARGLTCMVNIIGRHGEAKDLLRLPYTHLHLYDKSERAGRKLGHVNVQADSYRELVWRAMNVASYLPGTPELSCSLLASSDQL
ncbi:5-(carboxyamino)imidazole ribonucleotide synthase [Mangrovitalea sediminis]|uniref:5-(carboxyamino)imidazole ribonucleotide synthase n=1 Tax=Mangrovitalea sediminis TaxID=1982043 RepID=UPI000BE5FA0F|nr:5-(carboxyamino)imidazole ribonucleotide synthase [Mangrovitalea sediminis]